MAKAFLAAIALALALSVGNAVRAAALPELRVPGWAQLSAGQQLILAPLKAEWDDFDDAQRRKWLGLAKRFPSMPEEERQRVQQRMRDWAKLSPEQRRHARRQYRSLQHISPDQREALKQRWQEYEKLPDAERKVLKENAARRPPRKPGRGMVEARPTAPTGAKAAPLAPAAPNAPSASADALPPIPLPARVETPAEMPERSAGQRP